MSLRRTRAVALLVVVGAALSTTACQRKLFPSDQPRTQFQTYDRLRQQDASTDELDVYGRPRPNLRARLTPST